MPNNVRDELERLIGEAESSPDAPDSVKLARARLAASLAEGLGAQDAAAALGDTGADDLALLAAYREKHLSEPERTAFVALLARNSNLRADLASGAALLDALEAERPSGVPPDLLTRAKAEFAAGSRAPAPKAHRPPVPPSRRRLAWVSLFLLAAVVVSTPGVLRIINQKSEPVSQVAAPPPVGLANPPAAAPAAPIAATPPRFEDHLRVRSTDAQMGLEPRAAEDETSPCDQAPQTAAAQHGRRHEAAVERKRTLSNAQPARTRPCPPAQPSGTAGVSRSPHPGPAAADTNAAASRTLAVPPAAAPALSPATR